MSEYIIEMKNITKRFPGIVANDNVTIQIKKGEIYALLGENGAGKSTLMSMLFGMYEPDEGEILVRGKKETISSPKYATKLNIGMVHQHFKLVSNFTITENIIMGMEPMKKFMGVLPYVNVKESNKKIEELSKQFFSDDSSFIYLFPDFTKYVSNTYVKEIQFIKTRNTGDTLQYFLD